MSQRDTVRSLLDAHGTTYAEAAGITMRDEPMPLFQLLVLALLSSARISADIATDAARELFGAGYRTPAAMREATWQQRVDALGAGGYRRYDESTSTKLEEAATHVLETYGGDLRAVRPSSHDGVPDLEQALQDVPRIGPTGAGIFCREVQTVWPTVAPYLDERARAAASRLGLPGDPAALARLAPDGDVARLAAALVRSDLDE